MSREQNINRTIQGAAATGTLNYCRSQFKGAYSPLRITEFVAMMGEEKVDNPTFVKLDGLNENKLRVKAPESMIYEGREYFFHDMVVVYQNLNGEEIQEMGIQTPEKEVTTNGIIIAIVVNMQVPDVRDVEVVFLNEDGLEPVTDVKHSDITLSGVANDLEGDDGDFHVNILERGDFGIKVTPPETYEAVAWYYDDPEGEPIAEGESMEGNYNTQEFNTILCVMRKID